MLIYLSFHLVHHISASRFSLIIHLGPDPHNPTAEILALLV